MEFDNAFQTFKDILNWNGWPLIWYLVVFSVVVLWLALVFWTLKDARKRVEDTLVVAVAVLTSLVFPYIGTLVYAILRPAEYLADARERELEIRAMEHEVRAVRACPSCREPVRDDYLVCPKCRRALRTPCAACGRPLEYAWKVCPYCAQEAVEARPMIAVGDATEALGR